MKQTLKKNTALKIVEVATAILVSIAPLSAYALVLPPCTTFLGLNCSNNTLGGLIITIINWMLAFAGVIAVLFLIIGGFWYVTSAGNEETAEKGKNTIINALIGIVVIVLSYVIVTVVSNLLITPSSSTTVAP